MVEVGTGEKRKGLRRGRREHRVRREEKDEEKRYRPDRVGVGAGHGELRGRERKQIPPLRGPTRQKAARKKISGRFGPFEAQGRRDDRLLRRWMRGSWGW